MIDLTEDTLAPDVVIRRTPAAAVQIRHGAEGSPPLVGVAQGPVWARAESDGPGVDLGHGSVNLIVRSGTILLDVQSSGGLVIVLRGSVEIVGGGEVLCSASAGQALSIDGAGTVGAPDPVDAAELAADPFVSLNLVLDALGGVPISLVPPAEPEPEPEAGPTDEADATTPPPEKKRGRGLFGGKGKR